MSLYLSQLPKGSIILRLKIVLEKAKPESCNLHKIWACLLRKDCAHSNVANKGGGDSFHFFKAPWDVGTNTVMLEWDSDMGMRFLLTTPRSFY